MLIVEVAVLQQVGLQLNKMHEVTIIFQKPSRGFNLDKLVDLMPFQLKRQFVHQFYQVSRKFYVVYHLISCTMTNVFS